MIIYAFKGDGFVPRYSLQRKKLEALGLAASMIVTLSACSEPYEIAGGMSIVEGEVPEVTEEIRRTSDYYLVRLEDKIYLTMGVNSSDEDNIIRDYYDVKTGDLIGRTLNVYYYNRALSQANKEGMDTKIHEITPDNNLRDYNYFNGEYGLGKLLPPMAVTTLSEFLSTEFPSNQDLEFFGSNSDALHELLDGKIYKSYNYNCYKYEFRAQTAWVLFLPVGDFWGYHSEEYNLTNGIAQYTCITLGGEEEKFVGYRLSIDNSDNGYNYIYDIMSGDIVYIGSAREEAFKEVREEKFNNTLTVKELRKRYNTIENIEVKLDEDVDVTLDIDSDNNLGKIKAEDLYIVDMNSESVVYKNEEYDKYYLFVYDGFSQDNPRVKCYKDLYHEYGYLSVCGKSASYGDTMDGFFQITGYDFENNVYFDDFGFKPLNEFLQEHGLNDLIKDVYSLEDYDAIYNYLLKEYTRA